MPILSAVGGWGLRLQTAPGSMGSKRSAPAPARPDTLFWDGLARVGFMSYMVFSLGSPQTPETQRPIVSGFTCIFLHRHSRVSCTFSLRSLTLVQKHWPEPRMEAHVVHPGHPGGSESGGGVAPSRVTGLRQCPGAACLHRVTTGVQV